MRFFNQWLIFLRNGVIYSEALNDSNSAYKSKFTCKHTNFKIDTINSSHFTGGGFLINFIDE